MTHLQITSLAADTVIADAIAKEYDLVIFEFENVSFIHSHSIALFHVKDDYQIHSLKSGFAHLLLREFIDKSPAYQRTLKGTQ